MGPVFEIFQVKKAFDGFLITYICPAGYNTRHTSIRINLLPFIYASLNK